MRYQNETCSICEQQFGGEPGKDIVVCPDCGAPLHRACWAEQHQCPFSEQHGSYVWQPQAPEEPPADFDPASQPGTVCPVCGENCHINAARCPNCGTHFAEYANQWRAQMEQQWQARTLQHPFQSFTVNGRKMEEGERIGADGGESEGVAVEEAALHIRSTQRSVERYLSRFEQNRPVGWNWAAFIFGPYWLFFRKLYKAGLLLAGAMLVLNVALLFTPMATNYGKNIELVEPVLKASQETLAQGSDTLDQAGATVVMKNVIFVMGLALRKSASYLVARAAVILLPQIAAALLADRLLRRKVWSDIAIAHEECGGETPDKKYIRQRMILRRGGMTIFAPVLFFWANFYLPQLAAYIVGWLTT